LLKGGLAVLLRLGKLLAHMRHEAATKGILPPELAKELIQTRALVMGLERVTHDLINAALIAWESKYE